MNCEAQADLIYLGMILLFILIVFCISVWFLLRKGNG